MHPPALPLRHALSAPQLWPSLRNGLWVIALFAGGVLVARLYAEQIQGLLAEHATLGAGIFLASSAIAVLLPLLSNLPLVPAAVVAWGPWPTAALLLLGWIAGAGLAFALGRHARRLTLRHFPSAQRHADIDRLIHPDHRLLSLVLLRMTFPVDVLSYALGLFSRSTTAAENLFSTTLGAAPFALLFVLFPTLPASWQGAVFAASVLAFGLHALWVWRGPQRLQ
jgi:membrane protein YqaA with SNARE-associated domain